ncbi:flagellar export protein FliJ [Aquabacterium olei]|uniref:Flagellar FliJ protein n=1 Tax=Aquabacterium olei TaxID=1296669 RepID=A0A2U8FPV0_9BURK|nr:flagellar export protein FliJ [Aquabacterium olei]AWI53039.1 flagellar export protein FliJ [Aquabacterium olei]
MSGAHALLMVLESAEKARDEALSALDAGRKALDAAQRQAQSLTDWRRDYEQRWQAQFRQSGGMEILRCYQDFMARLAEAVGEQDRRVSLARANVDRLQAQLIERERRVAAVSQLIDRRHAEQQVRAARQEQKATDEMAARLTRGGSGLGGTLSMAVGPL